MKLSNKFCSLHRISSKNIYIFFLCNNQNLATNYMTYKFTKIKFFLLESIHTFCLAYFIEDSISIINNMKLYLRLRIRVTSRIIRVISFKTYGIFFN